VQLPEPPKYKSPSGTAKRQTIFIDSKDPRAKKNNPNNPTGRSNAEVVVTNVVGNSFLTGAAADSAVLNETVNPSNIPPDNTLPALNNNPPLKYPGGSGPQIIVYTDPTNVVATWEQQDALSVSFTWDPTITGNSTATNFIVQLSDSSGFTRTYGGFPINESSSSQTLVVTRAINIQMFNSLDTNLTGVAVQVSDTLDNTSNMVSGSFSNVNIFDLPAPILGQTLIITAVNNGYSVSFTAPTGTSTAFGDIDVWEIESTATSAPAIIYASDGITPTNYNRTYFGALNPQTVLAPDTNQRYVIARFGSESGRFTSFSSAAQITPLSPVLINVTPPTEVSSVSANWDSTNSNYIDINYTMPSTNAGVSFIAKLIAPNGLIGYFYLYPDGTGNLTQLAQITDAEMYLQFGAYYTQFTGTFISVSSTGVRSSGISFTVSPRTSILSTTAPTPVISSTIDGYVGTFDFSAYPAKYAEVYTSYVNCWASLPNTTDIPDFFNAYYVSGGAVGTNTITLNNWTDDDGIFLDPTPYLGYAFSGIGVPNYSYISAISLVSSGVYQVKI
jgi:hypothetical protein